MTSWLPQRQSFRGKRFTATWTFLFERLGRSSTPWISYREYRSATLKNVLISAVKISRLRCNVVNLPTSINLAFIPPQIKDYGVGIPAELAKLSFLENSVFCKSTNRFRSIARRASLASLKSLQARSRHPLARALAKTWTE